MKTIYGEAEKLKYQERTLQASDGWYVVFQKIVSPTYISDIRPLYYPPGADILRIKHILYTFCKVK